MSSFPSPQHRFCGPLAQQHDTASPWVRSMAGSQVFGRARLVTEPIGSASVTFAGINAGSEIRVYIPDGTEVAGIESCSADQVLSWPAYATGNPNNVVTIRIISLAHKVIEMTYTSAAGSIAIPIQQQPDPWYSNP